MQQQIYKCKVTNYNIEYIIDSEKKTALLNMIISDYKYIKALMNLLRNSIDDLQKKNISRIRQLVSKEEWDFYLKEKTTWMVIGEAENHYQIECPIDDFLENYGRGIGLFEVDV